MSSSKILDYGVDLYRLNVNNFGRVEFLTNNGEVYINGDLRVEGNVTSLNTENLVVNDNIIVLNNGESGFGISKTSSGFEIDRGTNVNVTVVFDESIGFLNPGTPGDISDPGAVIKQGSFKFSDINGKLIGLYTNSINTLLNQDLYLNTPISGIVRVRPDYKFSVFDYDGQTINPNIFVSNALVNTELLVDYVQKVMSEINITGDRITAINDLSVRVVAESIQSEFSDNKTIKIWVGSQNPIATFTETEANIEKIVISDRISSLDNVDLILTPGLNANVSVSGSRISNVADPLNDEDAVNKRTLDELKLDIASLLDLNLEDAEDGSVLVYNLTLGKFEVTKILQNQIIDAGEYE